MQDNTVAETMINLESGWLRETVDRWVARHNTTAGAPAAMVLRLPFAPALHSTGPIDGEGGLLVDFGAADGESASAIWVAATGRAVTCASDDEVEIATFDVGGFANAEELTERLEAAAALILGGRGPEQGVGALVGA